MENKLSRRPLPPPLEDWDHPRAHFAKHGFISTEFDFAIDPRLGKPFQTLVARLHSVFTNLLYQKLFAERRGDPPPAVDHNEIYDLMLSHVRDAIDELNRETNDGITMPRKLSHEEANVITQNEEEPQSSIESWSMIPACKKIMRTLATNRARRKKSSLRVTDQVRNQVLFSILISSWQCYNTHRYAVVPDIPPKRNGNLDVRAFLTVVQLDPFGRSR